MRFHCVSREARLLRNGALSGALGDQSDEREFEIGVVAWYSAG